jgi:hypothetical protein
MVHEVFDGYRPVLDEGEASDAARSVIDDVASQGFGES